MIGAPNTTPRDSPSTVPTEADEGEQQPLLRREITNRSVSRDLGQQQFQQTRQEAAQEAAMSSGWFTWVLVFFTFCVFAFWFYVNIRSWYVLFVYYNSPCDQPLAQWLLVKLFLDVLSSSAQQRQRSGDPPRPITWLILGCQNAWLMLGFNWCSECKTCQTTTPQLFSWVQFLVIFGTIVTIFLMLLPVIFYMGVLFVVHMINSGRIKNHNAAREETLNLLEKVEFCPDLFADSSDPNDDRPSCDCIVCCDDFGAEKAIVRTPCEHYFHQECLGEWLKLAKTCPVCRCDLDIATEVANTTEKEADLGSEEKGSASSATRSSVVVQASTSSDLEV